jgi:hypothetical protein
VQVVRHYYEIVQPEFALHNQGTQYVYEKLGISLRLQQAASHARLGSRKKGASGVENVFR